MSESPPATRPTNASLGGEIERLYAAIADLDARRTVDGSTPELEELVTTQRARLRTLQEQSAEEMSRVFRERFAPQDGLQDALDRADQLLEGLAHTADATPSPSREEGR